MNDTAKEMKSMGLVDDPIVLFWWPRICDFLGIDVVSSTAADREKFLDSLPDVDFLKCNGPCVCTSRWGTFTKAEAWRRPHEAVEL